MNVYSYITRKVTEEFMKSDEFINMLGGEYKKDNLGRNNGYPMLKWQK